MLLLLGISSLLSLATALVLGIRLLGLARRTRGVPELAMGLSFIVGGFFGFLLILVGNPAAGQGASPALAELLFRLGTSLLGVGIACTYVFVCQTFRPDSPTARVLTIVAIVCILGALWPMWTGPIETALLSPIYMFGEIVRMGSMIWGCSEALSYHTVMRRRLALGLADALVTNRFLLWGIAMAAGTLTSLTGIYMTVSGLVDPSSWPYLAIGIFATVSPVAQWLAFFPPRAYRRWVQGDAATAG